MQRPIESAQYTVINGPDQELRRKSLLDLEQDALLLDALRQGPEAAVVVHVGGRYGDGALALERWAAAWELLSESARRRLAVEHDETSFDLADALVLHRRTGVRVIFDLHHHRCLRAAEPADTREALAAAYATWAPGVRPKAHLSSPRTELRVVKPAGRAKPGRLVPPLLDQHADFATPWDLLELLSGAPGAVDIMVEAKAKDLAVLWLRRQLERLDGVAAAAEERSRPTENGSGVAGDPAARRFENPEHHVGEAHERFDRIVRAG